MKQIFLLILHFLLIITEHFGVRSCHSNCNKFSTTNKQEVKITLYVIKFLRGEECLKIHCLFLICSEVSFGIINMIYNTLKGTYFEVPTHCQNGQNRPLHKTQL